MSLVSRGVCQRTLGWRSVRFVSLSYHYFLPALINCLFSVDFPCFMRPTSAINVTSPTPSPCLVSCTAPLLLSPSPSHFMTIYSGYVTFLAKNTFRPGQLLMNGYTREVPFLFLFRDLFFCFRSSRQSTSAFGAHRLVITILVSRDRRVMAIPKVAVFLAS